MKKTLQEERYNEKMEEIEALLEKIRTGLQNHREDFEKDPIWASVSELGHIESELQTVSDFINQEGECAPEEPFDFVGYINEGR